jgi:hypothetical protein
MHVFGNAPVWSLCVYHRQNSPVDDLAPLELILVHHERQGLGEGLEARVELVELVQRRVYRRRAQLYVLCVCVWFGVYGCRCFGGGVSGASRQVGSEEVPHSHARC